MHIHIHVYIYIYIYIDVCQSGACLGQLQAPHANPRVHAHRHIRYKVQGFRERHVLSGCKFAGAGIQGQFSDFSLSGGCFPIL